MGHLIRAAIGIVIFGVIAAIVWWRFSPSLLGPAGAAGRLPTPDLGQIRQLQAQADAACLCDRRSPDVPWDRVCWAEFDHAVEMFAHWEQGTACMEESVSQVCFGNSDFQAADQCVFRQRIYSACSEEEGRRRQVQARASGNSGCE